MKQKRIYKLRNYFFKKVVKSKFFDIVEEEWIGDSYYDKNQFSGIYQIQKIAILFNSLIDAEAVFVGYFSKNKKRVTSITFIANDKLREIITTPAEFFDFSEYNFGLYPKIISVSGEETGKTLGLNSKMMTYVPLLNQNKKIIGVLASFFNYVNLSSYTKNTFKYFTSLFSSELHLIALRNKLRKQNQILMQVQLEMEHKNNLLERLNSMLSHSQKISKESAHLKSAFLSNLSHEIKTPMNVILGFTEFLNSKSLTHDEIIEYTGIIRNSGLQLLQVLDSLIDISKIQADEMVYTQRSFPLNQLLAQVYDNYHPKITLAKKEIDFKYVSGFKTGEDIIKNKKESIFKVLSHLVDNAIKFTNEGEIIFGYDVFETKLQFFVKDTGIGVPEGQESYIFDIFRQSDISKTRGYGGNGLGLHIAKKLVHAMGGEIWYERRENGGSCFYFTVPV